ncbi:DUF2173 family protein [Methanofollis formosanus]|nr:DUF2173 family protein [Methanofollis formosanus]
MPDSTEPGYVLFEVCEDTAMSSMKWVPRRVWMYSGGDWTVIMGGNRCIFIETTKVDFNHLHRVMSAESVSRQKFAAPMR